MMVHPSRIGIDIGRMRVKAAQADRRGRIVRMASFPRCTPIEPAHADEASHIAETLLRQGFTPAPVVLASDRAQVRIEELALPVIEDETALSRIAASEVARVTHWAPGTFEFANWSIPTSSAQGSAANTLAVACTHANGEAAIEPLAAAGFDVEAIDVRSAALVRSCTTPEADSGMVCVADLGWEATCLSASLDGTLVFVRTLPSTGVKCIATGMELDPDYACAILERLCATNGFSTWGTEAVHRSFATRVQELGQMLSEELKRTFAYMAHRFPNASPISTFLCGGGARLPSIAETVHALSGLEVMVQTPMRSMSIADSAHRYSMDPSLICAMGLARWTGEPT